MNELELIYNNKIIKFKYDKFIVINSDDREFYSLLIDSLKGKNKNSLFNRREIIKNEFAVYEINGSTTLADEFKYGSKSFILKRVQELIEKDEEEYNSIAKRINEDFNELNIKLSDYLGICTGNTTAIYSVLDVIKKLYNPVYFEEMDALQNDEAFFRNVFEFCNNSVSFVVVDLRESKKDFINVLKLLELVENYSNVTLIIFENDINNLFNLSLKYDVYLSNLKYCEFNACVGLFERENDLILDISMRILLINSIISHQNNYEVFLKNASNDERILEIIRKFKKFYDLKIENNAENSRENAQNN